MVKHLFFWSRETCFIVRRTGNIWSRKSWPPSLSRVVWMWFHSVHEDCSSFVGAGDGLRVGETFNFLSGESSSLCIRGHQITGCSGGEVQYRASFCRSRSMSCHGWTCLGELWRVLKLQYIRGGVRHTRSTFEQRSVLCERSFFQCWKVEWRSVRVTAQVGQFTPFQCMADVMRCWCQHSVLPGDCAGTTQEKLEQSLQELKVICSRLVSSSPALILGSWFIDTWLVAGCSAFWTRLCGSHARYCNNLSFLSSV